jgi:hypothetical protein
MPKVSEMIWNTPVTPDFRLEISGCDNSQTSFWVQWTRMDASQLWYPEIVHSGSNTSFASFTYPRLANALKHSQISFWVQWSRMDASQLWYPEIVHSGSNTSFASFTYPSLANALKHSQASFWVQWTRMDASQLWYPRNSAFRPKPQVLQVFTCRRLAKCSETLPNIILGPMD